MRPRNPLLFVLLATSMAGMWSAHAQTAPQIQRGPDNGPDTYIPGIDVLPLPGLPFSANDKIVWTRPIEGGGSITTYLDAKAIRDSQGRLYRERHRFGPANVDPESTLIEFSIDDPVSHTHTLCNRASHLCHITGYQPRLSFGEQPVGSFDQGRRYLTRESIGTQSIQELSVVGTLEKVSIAPGTVGNDQLITLSREFWYSPDLKTNLAVTRKDPRVGTQAITLIILSRSDPDPSVFTVPTGYRVQDDRHIARPPS
jgi:hypothetical protein